jgi:putative ABC transport system ATP-binding protein
MAGLPMVSLRSASKTYGSGDSREFQAFNLLPSLTAEQNVGLPLRLAGKKPDRASVGKVPTRALDSSTGREVLKLLRGVADEAGQTVIMVTHDPVAASYTDSVLFLADGKIVGELTEPTVQTVAQRMAEMEQTT